MTSINEKIIEIFGTWVTEFAPILLLAAILFAFLFFITVIGAIIRACVLKGRIKKLRAANAAAANAAANGNGDERVAELATELEQKQARIDELEEQLAVAQSNPAPDADTDANTTSEADGARIASLTQTIDELNDELDANARTIAELNRKLENGVGPDAEKDKQIERLERTIKDKDSEINLLKAENSQIKAQALQQQLADSRSAAEKQKADKQRAADKEKDQAEKQSAATKATAPSAEDEYDEYYDDYGDETSAVKVTLKFDRVKNNWVILRTDTDRAYRRLATKQEALVIAKDLARRLHAQLVVHKKDGKFQHI